MHNTIVVILNWNGRQVLEQCLPSVIESARDIADLWIVDNGSSDDSVDYLKKEFPDISLFCLQDNLGFGKAYNFFFEQKIAGSHYKYMVLLNNDVKVSPDWCKALIDQAGRAPEAAAITSLLYLGHSDTIQNAGLIMQEWGACDSRLIYQKALDRDLVTEEVFGLCGGAALISTHAFEQVGGFDPHYFAYYEDADLSMKLRLSGYSILFEPDAVAWHLHSSSTKSNPMKKLFLLEKYRLYFQLKFFPWCLILKNILFGNWKYLFYKKKHGTVHKSSDQPMAMSQVAWTLLKAWFSAVFDLPKALAERKKIRQYTAFPMQYKKIFSFFLEKY